MSIWLHVMAWSFDGDIKRINVPPSVVVSVCGWGDHHLFQVQSHHVCMWVNLCHQHPLSSKNDRPASPQSSAISLPTYTYCSQTKLAASLTTSSKSIKDRKCPKFPTPYSCIYSRISTIIPSSQPAFFKSCSMLFPYAWAPAVIFLSIKTTESQC